MKCENCGAKIRKWDTYCPKCGMELFNSEQKPLKSKYLRGEYREEEEVSTQPYDLDEKEHSTTTYHDVPHQNHDDYQNMGYNQYDDEDYHYNPDKDNKKHNQDENYQYNQKSDKRHYKKNKNYNKNYNRNRNYDPNYTQKGHPQRKYPRGYDLDEYYGAEETKGSIWGTVLLLLLLALLIGLVMGFIFFSGSLMNT